MRAKLLGNQVIAVSNTAHPGIVSSNHMRKSRVWIVFQHLNILITVPRKKHCFIAKL